MKVYLIGGQARNGKDTFGGFLKEYYQEKGKKVCVMHLSSYIKHMAIDYFNWDGSEETKPRTLLQNLGTDIIRVKMKKDKFFINRIIEDIEILNNFFDIFIITDVRFPIEYEEIKKAYPNTIKIHITRPNFVNELNEKEKKHSTETALNNYDDYDYKIINRDLEDLKKDAWNIVDMEEKNEI